MAKDVIEKEPLSYKIIIVAFIVLVVGGTLWFIFSAENRFVIWLDGVTTLLFIPLLLAAIVSFFLKWVKTGLVLAVLFLICLAISLAVVS